MRWFILVASLFFSTAQAAPVLSDAYARPTTTRVSAWTLQDTAPSPSAASVALGTLTAAHSDADLARARRGFRVGSAVSHTGLGLAVVGTALIPVGIVGGVLDSIRSNGANSTLYTGLTVGGLGLAVTGGVVSNLGAMSATRSVNRFLGTEHRNGMAIRGLVLGTAGLLLTPVFGIGLLAPVAGAALGHVQLSGPRESLQGAQKVSVSVLPTPQGMMVAGQF